VALTRRLKDAVPDEIAEVLKTRFRSLARPLNARRYRGTERYCPICESHVRAFKPAGIVPRPNARCPICGSLERHRVIWLYLTEYSDLFDGRRKRLLHVSPEQQLEERIRKHPQIDYLSGDLESRQAMVRLDITDIHYGDDTFDVIICNHVLEHVPNDRLAMRELFRVLRPGGWAILQTPTRDGDTYEDPSITDPEDRVKHFGQRDHVRIYGHDFFDRLQQAGFFVEAHPIVQEMSPAQTTRLGLDRADVVHVFRKADGPRLVQ